MAVAVGADQLRDACARRAGVSLHARVGRAARAQRGMGTPPSESRHSRRCVRSGGWGGTHSRGPRPRARAGVRRGAPSSFRAHSTRGRRKTPARVGRGRPLLKRGVRSTLDQADTRACEMIGDGGQVAAHPTVVARRRTRAAPCAGASAGAGGAGRMDGAAAGGRAPARRRSGCSVSPRAGGAAATTAQLRLFFPPAVKFARRYAHTAR